MIKVSDLHKSFGKLEVLKGIDENIEKGEKIVVIGPSGSGKSTFLRCLNLLETPTSGQIGLTASALRIKRQTSTGCAAVWAWCFSTLTV